MHWQKISLIGVGLLGGSLGLAIRQRRLAGRVEGYVRRAARVAQCQRLGVVDAATLDLRAAVTEADLIILCTPIGQMREVSARMASSVRPGAIVTDVGSVKASVIQELEPLFAGAGAHFVGSHPMAGAEKMGVGAAQPELFAEAICAITPTMNSNPQAVSKVEEFWRAILPLLGGGPGRSSHWSQESLRSPQPNEAEWVRWSNPPRYLGGYYFFNRPWPISQSQPPQVSS